MAEAIDFRARSMAACRSADSSTATNRLRSFASRARLSKRTEIANLTRFLERADDVRGLLASDQFPLLSLASAMQWRISADCSAKSAAKCCRTDRSPMMPASRSTGCAAISKSSSATIHQSLERFLKSHRDEGVLQEEYVTIRNDRFVVPVVAGQKRRVDGVIHGASSSGQTLFVEPLDTIDLNNELVRLREEEQREVFRILREITDKLRAHAADIRRTMQVVSELDLLFAKAAFAGDFDCVIPTFAPDRERRVDAAAKLAIRCCRMSCAGSRSASFL